jgi:hypothetical protein
MTNNEPDYRRLVADADVLAADVLTDGASRVALDTIRAHSWLDLIATEPLLADARAVIEELADHGLAVDWRNLIEKLVTIVEQPKGDHPALAAAYQGDATQIISLDGRLQSPTAGANLREVMDVSVRSPDAFVSVFDPEPIYELAFESPYPGPDRDARE